MRFLNLLFRGQKDEAVEALRLAVAANQKERDWQAGIRQRAHNKIENRRAAAAVLGSEPNDTNVQRFVAFAIEAQEADAWGDAAGIVAGPMSARRAERTRPVLEAALLATKARLEKELAKLIKTEDERASQLEIPKEQAASPIRLKIIDAVSLCDSYAQQLPRLDDGAMQQVIKFVLSDDQ